MPNDTHIIVVAGSDGKIVTHNKLAQQKLGTGTGKYCWDFVGSLENAENLPCRKGCTLELLGRHLDSSQNTRIKHNGKYQELTCIPSNDKVVCVLTSDRTGPMSMTLSPREQQIMKLLADGETTASTAKLLGVKESTIRTHIERMREKLLVNTRAAIVAEGFSLGYLG